MRGLARNDQGRNGLPGLVADYGRLLYESAYSLALIADGDEQERAECFDALEAVEFESRARHRQILRALATQSHPAVREYRALAAALHGLMTEMVRVGGLLADHREGPLPDDLVAQVDRVAAESRSLSDALDGGSSASEIHRHLSAVRIGMEAVDSVGRRVSHDGGADAALFATEVKSTPA